MSASRQLSRPGFRSQIFAYGFRPFFFLAAIYAIVPTTMLYWALASGQWPDAPLPLFAWHGHEMLFGFVAAAIAGFLLTAVPTWTNTRAVSGLPLIALVLLWLAGRIVMSPWVQVSDPRVLVFSVAFFPLLAIVVSVPLIRTRNYRNWPFLVLLATLFMGDVLFHARYFNWTEGQVFDGLRLTINIVALMIVVVGGRITPAFTRNALFALHRQVAIRSYRVLDVAAIVAVVAVVVGDVIVPNSAISGSFALIAGTLILWRLSGWGGLRALDIPLIWILHLGALWLVIGFWLKGLWFLYGFGWAVNWAHAFTAGAFGTMILGVMTRVALGHTGRPLQIARSVVVSYALVTIAALTRVFGPTLLPGWYTQVLAISVTAWTIAFLLFLIVYTPILSRPRLDGREG